MKKLTLFLTLTISILCGADPGWCTGSNTTAFTLSVFLPGTVTLISDEKAKEESGMTKDTPQMIQEDHLKRSGRTVLVRSIVAR
jgi:hypothetical protein